MRILHLEDCPDKRYSIQSLLEEHEFIWVNTWVSMMKVFKEDKDFDLVILDRNVPLREGERPQDLSKASVKELRRKGYDGPIIFITGDTCGLKSLPSCLIYSFGDIDGWLDYVTQLQKTLELSLLAEPPKRNRFRRDLVRCGTISYEEFIKWREVKPQTGVRFKTLNDALVKFDSSRYTVFEKNRVCVGCGKPGSYFAIERQRHHITWHLNFYMLNKEGVEILMTKDHIFPRSRGGKNTLSNYQTMCWPCNNEKADKI